MEQFARALDVGMDEFADWLDTVKVPDGLPKNVFVTCRKTEDAELHLVGVFEGVHTTHDLAEAQVDRLTQATGPLGYVIVEAPLNP